MDLPLPTPAPDPAPGGIDDVEWIAEPHAVAYPDALAAMEARVAAIRAGTARERIWLLEHPPLYTAGTSAQPAELIDPRFPVFATGRGGRYTYHGPGQRIGYVMLDLARRGRDVRCYVHALENWVIAALRECGIAGYAVDGRVGIWTQTARGEAKIGAIGVRVRQWVTLHGFSVNLAPDLSHFGGIVPCGLPEFPVTSAEALGKNVGYETFDAALALTAPAFLRALDGLDANCRLEGRSHTV